MYRRYRGDMIEVYKCGHLMYEESVIQDFLKLRSGADESYELRGHEFSMKQVKFNKNIRKYSFAARVVNQWNNLPKLVAEAPSLNAFKNRLDNLWKATILYDPNCDVFEKTSSRRARYLHANVED